MNGEGSRMMGEGGTANSSRLAGMTRLAFVLLLASAVASPLAAPLAAQRRIGMIPVGASELRDTVALYSTDRAALGRRWTVEFSPTRRARLATFYEGWRERLRKHGRTWRQSRRWR